MINYDAMLPQTRLAASAAGMTRYNTGKPCAAGHLSDRYTSTGNCCECLKSRSREFAAVRQSKTPNEHGTRLFTYRLHPDDHAAALAFCQALDLQRGRMPSQSQAVVASVPSRAATPAEVEAHRARILGAAIAAAEAPAGAHHMPAEMAAVLRGAGLLT